eukprot:363134-Chlamydomonas_euryale.AAC.1
MVPAGSSHARMTAGSDSTGRSTPMKMASAPVPEALVTRICIGNACLAWCWPSTSRTLLRIFALPVEVAALVAEERVCHAVGGLDNAGRVDRDDRVAARTKQPKAPIVGRAALVDLHLLRLLLLIRHRVVLCRCPGVVLDRLQEACVRTQQLDRTWVPLQHHTVRLVCERFHHVD